MTTSTNNTPSARKLAYQALFDVLEKDAYANITLQGDFKKYNLSVPESHLLTELTYGVLRRYNTLCWIILGLSKYPLKKLHPAVRILLCLALYQILYLDRVPDSAAVNETVKIAKKVTHQGNVRFINGLLRNFLRKRDTFAIPTREENPLLHLSLTYNEPEWLIRKWMAELGEARTEDILSAFNRTAPLTIRRNPLKMTRESFLSLCRDKNIALEPLSFYEDGFTVTEGADHFFRDILPKGLAYVQSASSMVPPLVLAPKAGERVLDMCAAPGSKSTEMGELMGNEGRIDAWDLYPHKVKLIEANAKREGLTCIHAAARDASEFLPAAENTYDKVLLDAPCSGLGDIGHKLEIRWKRQEADLAAFPPLQRELLTQAARYVKPGGTLVYSTCTLNTAENEDMARWFITHFPDFTPVDFAPENGPASQKGQLTLWPDTFGSDGFFVAKFVRNK